MSNSVQFVANYVSKIAQRVKDGHTSEHTFRKDLEDLINALVPAVNVTNEPSQITDCGNPDFLISKHHIPIGFIEAKDVGKDLSSKLYKEQFDRYKAALDNLIITDYTVFEFYEYGELKQTVRLAYISDVDTNYETALVGNEYCEENYQTFIDALESFCGYEGQTIKSAQRLAVMMAGKARLLENTLYHALTSDEKSDDNSDLRAQFDTFKAVLIHDLTPADFADIYAQTLAYGMFAARLHDETFWQLVALGGELRQIHLLESPKLGAQIKALSLGYPISGDSSVTRKMTKTSVGFEPDEADSSIGKVWLNDTQYFTNVPLVAWEFYIGGYQPAQKWLKDRRERMLDHHDIKHYLNIIAALSLTDDIMQKIDAIDVV